MFKKIICWILRSHRIKILTLLLLNEHGIRVAREICSLVLTNSTFQKKKTCKFIIRHSLVSVNAQTHIHNDGYNLLHIDIISPMGNKLLGSTKAKCFTFITTSSSPFHSFAFTCYVYNVRMCVYSSCVWVCSFTGARVHMNDWKGKTEMEWERKSEKQFSWKPSFILLKIE